MMPDAAEVVGVGGCLTTPLTVTGIDQTAVRAAVARAFAEQRAFPFLPHTEWSAAAPEQHAELTAAYRQSPHPAESVRRRWRRRPRAPPRPSASTAMRV